MGYTEFTEHCKKDFRRERGRMKSKGRFCPDYIGHHTEFTLEDTALFSNPGNYG